METNQNQEFEINVLELLYVIRQKIWIVVASGIILCILAGMISYFMITPLYTSKSTLYVLRKTADSGTNLQDFQIGQQLTKDYMVLMKNREIVNKVIGNLGLDATYEELAGNVKISNPANTSILEITVDNPDPYLAKQLADEFAHVSDTQIKEMLASDAITKVLEGVVPKNPSSPNVKLNALIALLLGAFVSCSIIVVVHIMDDTVKSEEDVEKYLGISTLGLIPIETGTVKQAEIDKRKRQKQFTRQLRGMR